ncbi:MAG TPA: PIG-L family deacetylase [Terriglobales bacterium]|nr:PIG-L family deacetylase [Terriglobales bacterium]
MRLLCVTAHPDDEAGGFGGTLLHYRNQGVDTHVICLTPGQAATHRGNAKTGDELAATRRLEFGASCELLKISKGEVLDYPDGSLDKQDFYSVAGDLTRRIRQIRPQVIMTFGGEGAITAHPDHSMVSMFTTMAFHWAGRTNRYPEQLEKEGLAPHRAQKLYYATASFTLPDRQPVSLPPATTTIDIAPHFETKVNAFKKHTSQAPLFEMFENAVRQRGPRELFHLAAATTPRQMEHETDLFAGVVE